MKLRQKVMIVDGLRWRQKRREERTLDRCVEDHERDNAAPRLSPTDEVPSKPPMPRGVSRGYPRNNLDMIRCDREYGKQHFGSGGSPDKGQQPRRLSGFVGSRNVLGP